MTPSLFSSCYNFFHKFLLSIHFIRIDVVIGSLAMAQCAASVTSNNIPVAYWVILPLSVFIIYTVDQAFDVESIAKKHKPISSRRSVFLSHRDHLLPTLVSITPLLILVNYIILPARLFAIGMITGILSLLYLGALNLIPQKHLKYFPKEIFGGFLYTFGIWGIPLCISTNHFNLTVLFFLLANFTLATGNLILFALLDFQQDTEEAFWSFPRAYGKKTAEMTCFILFSLIIATNAIFVVFETQFLLHSLCFIIAGSIHFSMLLIKSFSHTSARKICDMSFFLFFMCYFYK